MSALSNYLRNKLLDHVSGAGPAFPQPEGLYVALFTVEPTAAGGGEEVEGGSYERQPLVLSAAVDGEASNTSEIEFPTATDNWGTIVAVGIFDAETDGNMLFHGFLTESKTISAGETFRFPAGNIVISVE